MTSDAPPPVLYKYYGPDRIDTIAIGTLRFSSPAEFNDTFDCDYLTRKQIDLKATAKAMMIRLQRRRRLGVFCMTENANDPLMWVHYGAKSSGFVLGFRTNDPIFSQNEATLKHVVYQDAPLIIPDPLNPPLQAAFTKPSAWSIENEWRCVREFKEGESHDVPFTVSLISHLVFGANMEDYQISRLLTYTNLLNEGGHSIAVSESEAIRKDWTFGHTPTRKQLCTTCNGSGYTTVSATTK